MLDRKPRRASGEYSATKVVAPAYSPPVEKPCTRRQAISRAKAQLPIVALVGSMPMAAVATDIMIMVMASTFCRPILSPSGPKTSPPMGRAMKLTAKPASTTTMRHCSGTLGTNSTAMVAVRYP